MLKCFGGSEATEAKALPHSSPLMLGTEVPNFRAETTTGEIDFHDYIQDSWAILFSHPDDFTPVCTTELATAALLMPEFEKRGVKVLALSVNSTESHEAWGKDVLAVAQLEGKELPYPIIADTERRVATLYNMMEQGAPMDKPTLTCRGVFVIGPDKALRMQVLYPASTGRDFAEIIRVIDSLQRTAVHKVATPVNWRPGKDVMVLPSVSDEEAATMFEKVQVTEVPSGKKYLRQTPDPAGPVVASAKKKDECTIS